MSSPDISLSIRLLTTRTEDPRPWVGMARQHRKIGSPPPEHGPWENEPDYAEWIDLASGYPCMARRNHTGAWCGYVCVPRDHPLHGHGYWDLDEIDVHGGLTFADGMLAEGDWWFGFDCAHAGDLTPGMAYFEIEGDRSEYRTLAYVMHEVRRLVEQLKEYS